MGQQQAPIRCHLGEKSRSQTCNLNAMNPEAKLNSIQGRTLQEYDKASYMAIYFKTSSELSASRIAGTDFESKKQQIRKEALMQ